MGGVIVMLRKILLIISGLCLVVSGAALAQNKPPYWASISAGHWHNYLINRVWSLKRWINQSHGYHGLF